MPKTLVRRSALERESRQGCAPRQRPIALVELIITAALALSTAVAATAVSTTAPLSLATISGGVPLGTHSPFQNEMYIPDTPTSSIVGTSGAAGQRSFDITAKGLIAPLRRNDRVCEASAQKKSICPATRSCITGAPPR